MTMSAIKAEEILDACVKDWQIRSWEARRDLEPNLIPFCDLAASKALASLSAIVGAAMPQREHFLEKGDLKAWLGEFDWGKAWCASRGDYFFAWAQGDGTSDARVEISGPQSQWDDDLADAFAESLAAGSVDKPMY